jgi:hypothetical protein
MKRLLSFLAVVLLCASPVAAQVAHDAVTESHTGTSGSQNQSSFSWTHTPVGTPRGILVFTQVNANADDATAVDWGGLSLTAVSGGRAVDTATEPGDSKAWFLGSGLSGRSNDTVTVTRNNNSNIMYAVAITVTANTDTQAVNPVLVQEDGSLVEQNVTDDSPGTNSVRYAHANSGATSPPTAGSNSTQIIGIDFGTRAAATARETTAGQGSRPVGFAIGTDDRAVVHLAVREAVTAVVQDPIGNGIIPFAR